MTADRVEAGAAGHADPTRTGGASGPRTASGSTSASGSTWAGWAAPELHRALEDFVAAGGAPGGVAVLGDVGDLGTDTDTDGFDAAGAEEQVVAGTVSPECGPGPPGPDTLYDVASVTKVLATWPLVGIAVREHGLDPDSPVRRYLALPGAPEHWPSADATIRQILAHVSGLMRRTRLDLYRQESRPLIERICAEPLERAPGEYRYLSRGYILLGLLLGRLFGRDFADAAQELVWRPAGMAGAAYGPMRRTSDVAPTERYFPDAPRLWGQAHDDAARLLGGVAGHAGVFAGAADLAAYARWLLDPACPLSGWFAESLRPRVAVETAAPETEGGPVGTGLTRGLGWMLTDGGVAYHDGFTGVSLYLRPQRDAGGAVRGGCYLALCTNAVYAGRGRPGLRKLRQAALDIIEAASVSGS